MQYATLELSGEYQEIGAQVVGFLGVAGRKAFRFDRFYEQAERIRATKAVRRVLVQRHADFAVPAFGGLEEVRRTLLRLRQAGKEVVFYAPEYGATDCVLASACSRRVLHPLGQVSFLGLARSALFFKRLLDGQGVGVTVIRRDRYKGAADRFRGEALDAYARRQYQVLLDGAVAAMREAIAEGADDASARGLGDDTVEAMLAGRVFTAPEALEAGLVDELGTGDDLRNAWKAQKAKDRSIRRTRGRLGSGARVAVLVFEGLIVDGESQRHPLFGQAIGDRAMVRTIRALREHRRVRAVVFRINSGGGSATASENIVRELAALHAVKPLVISMGPVAGSGGYWISTTGRRLFALPTTVTGSIGVITLFFDLSTLLERHGITSDVVKHGAAADFGSALRPMTEAERATVDKLVAFLYGTFVERVAEVRRKPPEDVRGLAEGRLWLGCDAHERGLVDELGGLHDAIEHAKRLLGVKRARVTFEPRQSRLARMLSRASSSVGAGVRGDGFGAASGGMLLDGSSVGSGVTGATLVPWTDASVPSNALALAHACLALHGRPLLLDPALFGLALGERKL